MIDGIAQDRSADESAAGAESERRNMAKQYSSRGRVSRLVHQTLKVRIPIRFVGSKRILRAEDPLKCDFYRRAASLRNVEEEYRLAIASCMMRLNWCKHLVVVCRSFFLLPSCAKTPNPWQTNGRAIQYNIVQVFPNSIATRCCRALYRGAMLARIISRRDVCKRM